MAAPPKQSKAESQGVAGRRSSRLAIAIPITIGGKDAAGNEFKENSRTLVINKHGAKISTAHQLALGAELIIENRALGRTAKSNVVWLGDRRSPKDPVEIGVQLHDAENIWGIEFPPEDWQEGPQGPPTGPGGQRLEPGAIPPPVKTPEVRAPARAQPKPAAAAPSPLPERPVTPAVPQVREVTKPVVVPPLSKAQPAPQKVAGVGDTRLGMAPATPAAPPTLPSDKVDAVIEAGLARLSQQAEATAGAWSGLLEEKLAKISNQVGFQTQASLQEAANRLEDKMIRSLEEQFGSFAGRLQASRGEFEALLGKFQELQKTNKSELENTRRNIEEAGWQVLESAVGQLNKRVEKELATLSSGFVEQTRDRVRSEASRAVETFAKQAGERLAKLTEEYLSKAAPELQTRQVRAAEQATEQINQLIQTATAQFDEKLRKMSDEVTPSLREEIEKSVEKTAGELISHSVQSHLDQAQNAFRAAEQSFQQQLEEMLEQLQGEVVKARMKVGKTFEQEAEKADKRVAELIAKRFEEAVGSFSRASEEALARLRGDFQKNETRAKTGAEEYRKRLEEFSASTLEGFHGKLEKAVQRVQEKSAKEVVDHLQRSAEKLLDSLAKDLQKHADETRDLLTEELTASGKGLLAQTQKQLGSTTQATLEFLTTQTKASAEEYGAHLRKSLEEFRDRSAHELDSHFQTLLETQREALLKQLQEESEATTDRAAAQTKSKVEEVVKEAIEAVNKQVGAAAVVLKRLHKEAEEASEQAGEQIKTKVGQVVEEANDMVNKQVGGAAVLLKDWEEQARARLDSRSQEIEAAAKTYAEAVQTRIREFAEPALDQLRKESEGLAGDFENRLRQAAHVFEDRGMEAIHSKIQKVTDELVEDSATRLRQQTQENLELIAEALKERRDRAVNEAAELFRTTIAQMFASLQPGAKKDAEREPSEPEEVKKRR